MQKGICTSLRYRVFHPFDSVRNVFLHASSLKTYIYACLSLLALRGRQRLDMDTVQNVSLRLQITEFMSVQINQ